MKLEDELLKIADKKGYEFSQRITRPIEGIRNSIRDEGILFLEKLGLSK